MESDKSSALVYAYVIFNFVEMEFFKKEKFASMLAVPGSRDSTPDLPMLACMRM